MHILYLSYSYWPPDFGGELLLCIERLQTLAARGHRITVLTAGKPGFPPDELRDGINILRSPVIHHSRVGRGLRRMHFAGWAIEQMQALNFDALHFGSLPGVEGITIMEAGIRITNALHKRSIPSVYVHSLADRGDQPIVFEGIAGSLRRRFLNNVDVHVSVSPAIHRAVSAALPDRQTLSLPNGTRDDIFRPPAPADRAEQRDALGYAPGDVVFTFLGSVGRRKGFDLIADAFARLSADHPSWRLLVLGPRSRADSQNIDEGEVAAVTAPVRDHPHVQFLGRIDDRPRLAQLLGASDVFLFPSRREGMGVAPMEAMACAVPPIIARLPDITDLASVEGETGLYIPPDDADALALAMLRLGTDDDLRARMGAAARTRIEQAFAWQHYINQWERLYAGDYAAVETW